jgi:hypothetical protein
LAASAQLLSSPDTLEPKIESVEYVPGEIGLHQRTWLKATTARDAQGNVSTNTEPAYVELADGLGYWDEDAQEYRESREEIQAYPNGAAALAGQTRVLFAKNLATPGAITLKLANGQELRSNVRGLSYFDWAKGKSVWVAQIRDDCEGVVLPPNQVAYPNAMSGVRCTVLYSYHRDSFSVTVHSLEAQRSGKLIAVKRKEFWRHVSLLAKVWVSGLGTDNTTTADWAARPTADW